MRTLIITGGSSGIGLATAECFAAHGYRVYNLSRRGENQDNQHIVHLPCDVTDVTQVQWAVKQVIEQTGQIDVLISNAGFGISGAVEFTALADAERQMQVNFFGAMNIVQAVLPHMRRQGSGSIVFVSSIAAILPIPYQSFYSASKAAVNALTLALRNEVSAFGIRVSALMPGDVHTGFTNARTKSMTGTDVYLHMQQAVEAMEKDEQKGMSPDVIARKLLSIAHKRCPAPLYTTGWQYHFFVFLERVLPKRWSNYIVGVLYR